LQCVAVCCRVLQSVAVCCSVLQCVVASNTMRIDLTFEELTCERIYIYTCTYIIILVMGPLGVYICTHRFMYTGTGWLRLVCSLKV